MYVAVIPHLPSHILPFGMPRKARAIAPHARWSVLDGLVSVTQQEWATSHGCVNGFSNDAA